MRGGTRETKWSWIFACTALALGCADEGGKTVATEVRAWDAVEVVEEVLTGWVVPKPFDPPAANGLVGRVIATDGTPIPGAVVSSPTAQGTTDHGGYYFLGEVPLDESFLVSVSAKGFSSIVKSTEVPHGANAILNVVLAPHVQSREADPAVDSQAVFPNLAVELEAESVEHAGDGGERAGDGGERAGDGGEQAGEGEDVVGSFRVRVSTLDASTHELHAAPGDFSAVAQGGGAAQLEVLGVANVSMDQEGAPLKLKKGRTAAVELLLPDKALDEEGDEVPLWSFDDSSGKWVEEETGVVTVSTAYPERLAISADVSHLGWWSWGRAMDMSCVRGTVTTCGGDSAPGATVWALGAEGTSAAETVAGASGEFCVPVARGVDSKLTVVSGWGANAVAQTVTLESPTKAASCGSGKCQAVDVALPCAPGGGDADCANTYFAPCLSAVSGRVTDSAGAAVPEAAVTTVSGVSTSTVFTGADGEYCAPAGLGAGTSVAALGPAGFSQPMDVTAASAAACPDGEAVADLVLKTAGSGTGFEEYLDLCGCPEIEGSVVVEHALVENGDPLLVSIAGGFGTVYAPAPGTGDPESGGRQPATSIHLAFYPACQHGRNDLPIATLSLTLEDVSTGLPLPEGLATTGLEQMSGIAASRPKLTGLMGNQTMKLVTTQGDAAPMSLLVFDSGEPIPGSTLTGHFDLVYRGECAPAGSLLRVVGTLSLPVRSLDEAWTAEEMGSEPLLASQCETVASQMRIEQGLLSKWSAGMVSLSLDGDPVPLGETGQASAFFQTSSNYLTLYYYTDLLTLNAYVYGAAAGENLLTSANFYLSDQTNCYFYPGPKSYVTILTDPTSASKPVLTGTIDAEFVRADWVETSCGKHHVTGTFHAPMCWSQN